MEDLTARLAETPLAEGLSRDEIRRIAEAGEIRNVPPGTLILEEGRTDDALIVVLEGEVDVLKANEHGELQCLVSLAETSVLGEIGLVLGEPANASVRTKRASELFVLDRTTFRSLVDAGDRSGTVLALSVARILAGRLQRMNQEAVELCERYEEALAQAGEPEGSREVQDLTRFKHKLLTEWNF